MISSAFFLKYRTQKVKSVCCQNPLYSTSPLFTEALIELGLVNRDLEEEREEIYEGLADGIAVTLGLNYL